MNQKETMKFFLFLLVVQKVRYPQHASFHVAADLSFIIISFGVTKI